MASARRQRGWRADLDECRRLIGRHLMRWAHSEGERAVRGAREASATDADLADCLRTFALTQLWTGDDKGAWASAREALSLDERSRGKTSAEAGESHRLMGWAAVELKRLGPAEVHLSRALEICRARHGAKSREVAAVLSDYYRVPLAARKNARAMELLEEARDILERELAAVPGKPRPEDRAVRFELSLALGRLHDWALQKGDLERAIQLLVRRAELLHVELALGELVPVEFLNDSYRQARRLEKHGGANSKRIENVKKEVERAGAEFERMRDSILKGTSGL